MAEARRVLQESGAPPWNKGKRGCYSEETLRIMGADKVGKPSAMKGKHFPPEIVEKVSQALRLKWQDPDYAFRVMKARGIKPNKPEQKIITLMEENKLPFKYVGDGQFILGGKCPDFLNVNVKKQVIELFGTYWHDILDVARRTEHFRQYGFDTLVIWEDELSNASKVVSKITKFSKRCQHSTAT
jgi:very-short-patch-repair endonuclease